MAKVFDFDASLGSFIDQVSGDVLTEIYKGVFQRREQSLAYYSNNLASIKYNKSINLNSDWSIVINTYVISYKYQPTTWYPFLTLSDLTAGSYDKGISINASRVLGNYIDDTVFVFTYTNSISEKKWSNVIITYSASTQLLSLFLNNVDNGTFTLAKQFKSPDYIYIGKESSHYSFGYTQRDIIYNHVLTATERQNLYRDFLNNFPMAEPKSLVYPKPTDLPNNDDGLLLAYNFKPVNGQVVDISGNGNNGTIYGAVSDVDGLVFDGTNDYISFSETNIGTINTVLLRIKLDGAQDCSIVGGAHAGSRIFIRYTSSTGVWEITPNSNGIDISYKWNIGDITDNKTRTMVLVRNGLTISMYLDGVLQTPSSSTTNSNADGIIKNLSRRNTIDDFHVKGEYLDFKVYVRALSVQEIRDYNNSWASRIALQEHFLYCGVGNLPEGWRVESGDFEIKEDSNGFYLYCNTGGVISCPIDLSDYTGSGYVKTLTGDLSGEGGTVDASSDLANSGGRLQITMTAGQKLYEIVITQGAEI